MRTEGLGRAGSMSDGGEDAEERQGGGKETGEGVGAGGEGGNADMSIDGVDGAEEQSESRGEGGADAGDDLEKAVFGSSGACLPPARSEIKGWASHGMLVFRSAQPCGRMGTWNPGAKYILQTSTIRFK